MKRLSLQKHFLKKDSYKFVNGLLDKISHQLQPEQSATEIDVSKTDETVDTNSESKISSDTSDETTQIKNYHSEKPSFEDELLEEEDNFEI